MTRVINFYGGPGTGKSTSAALAFSYLKAKEKSCELVQEYVKQWAWENRKPVDLDQFYFFGKQARKEYSLFNKVDIILTDSPVCLSSYFCQVYGTKEQAALFTNMAREYYKMVEDKGHRYEHVWLTRTKAYDPKGRFQTEEQARAIDGHMRTYLEKEVGINFTTISTEEKSVIEYVRDL